MKSWSQLDGLDQWAQDGPVANVSVPLEMPTNQSPLKPKPTISSLPSPFTSATNSFVQALGTDHWAHLVRAVNEVPVERLTHHCPVLSMPATSCFPSPLKSP